MSLLKWLKPPLKRYLTESDNDIEEDEGEVSSDVAPSTPDLTSDSSARGASTSTTSNNSWKQSKRFNTLWLKGRRHWLKYEKGVGMFCLLCQKYDKRPYDRDVWNKHPCLRIRLQSILNHEKCSPSRQRKNRE